MNARDGNTPERTDEQKLECEIRAKGLTAPRITPEIIDAVIASEHYFTAGDGVVGSVDNFTGIYPSPLNLLTFCVLVLRNGFIVTGESACASPENFDEQIGRDIAKRNARDKIWSLEGYQLRTRLKEAEILSLGSQPKAETFQDRLKVEYAELHGRTDKLGAFLATHAFQDMEQEDQEDLRNQLQAMTLYRDILGGRMQRLGLVLPV